MELRSIAPWLAGTSALLCATVSVAQSSNTSDTGSSLAACGGCGVFIFIVIAWFVLSIALLVWVARDAKARGMDGAILWMLLVLFLGLIGLVIYLFVRPKGDLIQCPNCSGKRAEIVHFGSHVDQAAALLNNDSILGWLNPAGIESAVHQGFVCMPLIDEQIRLETHLVSLAENRSQLVSEFARKFVKCWEERSMPQQLSLPIN